eukprot:3766767-Alexandrium_andersonii.AAC.1
MAPSWHRRKMQSSATQDTDTDAHASANLDATRTQTDYFKYRTIMYGPYQGAAAPMHRIAERNAV